MNKKIMSNSGVTLVALIITIIVMLILSAVSISLVIGNNGIITQATEARGTQEKASELEYVKLDVASALSKSLEQGEEMITKEKLLNFLSKDDQIEMIEDTEEEKALMTNLEIEELEEGTIEYYLLTLKTGNKYKIYTVGGRVEEIKDE